MHIYIFLRNHNHQNHHRIHKLFIVFVLVLGRDCVCPLSWVLGILRRHHTACRPERGAVITGRSRTRDEEATACGAPKGCVLYVYRYPLP